MYTEYRPNNSGGHWWLTDDDWRALEKAGWKIHWAHLSNEYTEGGKHYIRDEDGTPALRPFNEDDLFKPTLDDDGQYRWLGCIAKSAFRVGLPLREAALEWERVTGKSSTDAGCPCCGQPHNFTEYDDDGKWVASGPDTEYACSW